MDKIKQYQYPMYLSLLAILAVLGNLINLPTIILGSFFVMALALVYFKQEVLYFLPLLVFAPFVVSGNPALREYLLPYFITMSVVLLIDLFKHRQFKHIGSLGLALLLLLDAAALSLLNAPSFLIGLQGLLILFSGFLVYFYLINTLQPNELLLSNVAWLFVILSGVIFIQIFIQLYQSDLSLFQAMIKRDVNLRWIHVNDVLAINLMAIPLSGYLMHRAPFKLPYMVIMFLIYVPFMFVLAPISLFSGAILIVLSALYVVIKANNIKRVLIEGTLFVALGALGLYLINMRYDSVIWRIYDYVISIDRGHLSALVETFRIGIRMFRSNPIIGSGGISASIALLEEGLNITHYRNVFIQTLTLGTLGFLAFVYLQYRKIKLILKTEKAMRYFALSLLFVVIIIHGSFEPMYYQYLFISGFFLVLAALEVNVKAALK